MGALFAIAVLIGVVYAATRSSAGSGTTPSCPTEAKLKAIEGQIASGAYSPDEAQKLSAVYAKIPGCEAAARRIWKAGFDKVRAATPQPGDWVPGCTPPADFAAPAGWALGKAPAPGSVPGWSPPGDYVLGQPAPHGECPPGWRAPDYTPGDPGRAGRDPGRDEPPPDYCAAEVAALPDAPYPFHVGASDSVQATSVRRNVAALLRDNDPTNPTALRNISDFLASVATKLSAGWVDESGVTWGPKAELAAVYSAAAVCILNRAVAIETSLLHGGPLGGLSFGRLGG
jgi:hypothetical protein